MTHRVERCTTPTTDQRESIMNTGNTTTRGAEHEPLIQQHRQEEESGGSGGSNKKKKYGVTSSSVPPESNSDPRFFSEDRHGGESTSTSMRSFLSRFTSTDRLHALLKPGVGAAAFLIRDAVYGEVENPAEGAYDPYALNHTQFRNDLAVVCARLCSSRIVLWLHFANGWIMVLLTFIEPPHWCRSGNWVDIVDDDNAQSCTSSLTAKGIPAMADNTTDSGESEEFLYFPNSSSMLLTTRQSHIVDACCVSFFLFVKCLRIGRDGLYIRRYFRPGSAFCRRIAQTVCILLMVAGLATRVTVHHPYIRLFILWTMMHTQRRDVQVILGVLPETLNVLCLLGVFMLFYAWFGNVMFVGTEEGILYFSSLVEALWTLYICVTTANYPDVMMPAYNGNRWTALYFVSFMVISFFFLLNLILASIVNEYEEASALRKSEASEAANVNLKEAFKLMDVNENGRIDRETVMALFAILNEDFPEFRRLSDDETKLLFAILDQDGSSTITEDEFMNFGNVLLLEFIKASDYASWVELYFPSLYDSAYYQAFCKAVKSANFEAVVDIILVLNAVVIGIQSYPELSGQVVDLDPRYWDGSIDTVWELMESIFTCIYILEIFVKISVYGSRSYFENPKNVFDFTITGLAVVTSAIVYYPNEINNSRLIRMVVMARVMRLLRLLTSMERFQVIGAISVEILPKAAGVLLVLFSLMYLFAAMGVGLYGGLITRDPSNPLSHLVLNTDFSDNDYWANNFNDMISAMNVLFNLLVVNNWTQCEVGFEATTQSRWPRFYFLAFHILGVILMINLVVAFIINAFLEQQAIFKEQVGEEVVDGEAIIRDRRALFNASVVTGTRTGLSGGFIARYRNVNLDDSECNEQDRLRQLFTRTSSGGSEQEGAPTVHISH